MKTAFADTAYWIATLNPNDELWAAAKSVSERMYPFRIVTTDEVLVEVLAHFCDKGPYWRAKAAGWVRSILQDANTIVVQQTRKSLLRGLGLYEARPDKTYSLTDCISMATMREYGLADALTGDKHFSQEGLRRLLASNV